uniref:Uncharacterized protein n=1 Tax=Heterorhabditis bacteriophora TaxID=37862 RepID=A0A1I7WB06_HETBA
MYDVHVGEQVWSRHANQLRLRLKEPGQSQHTFGSLLDTFDLPTTTREVPEQMDDSSQTQCSSQSPRRTSRHRKPRIQILSHINNMLCVNHFYDLHDLRNPHKRGPFGLSELLLKDLLSCIVSDITLINVFLYIVKNTYNYSMSIGSELSTPASPPDSAPRCPYIDSWVRDAG